MRVSCLVCGVSVLLVCLSNDVEVQLASRFRVHLADLTRGGRGVVAERWAKKKVLIFLCLMVGSC